jgi:tetratricopeptide (TPR) repeat protein
MEPQMSARERYERGQLLRQIKMYDQALDDFRHAARDPQYAGKAHAQLALCFRAMSRHEDAAAAFREALTAPTFSSEETVHLLHLFGTDLGIARPLCGSARGLWLDPTRGRRVSGRGGPD